MRTIAVVSNNNAADIFVVKSELAVVNNGVSIIRNKIPEVQRVLEDVVPAITRSEYTSNQVLENTKGIQHDLKRTHGSIAAEMAMMRDQLAVLKGLMETQNNMHKYQAAELVQIKQAEGTLSTLLNTEDRAKASCQGWRVHLRLSLRSNRSVTYEYHFTDVTKESTWPNGLKT